MKTDPFFDELISFILLQKPSKHKLNQYKLVLCKKHKRREIPTDIQIFLHTPEHLIEQINPFLVTKPTRTGSGVTVIATMTAPFHCPHGSCTYCPGGPGSAFGDVPKSYTGKEPSTMRAIRHNFDPYLIIFNRLEQYIVIGQNPQKVEQIIMGGTFPAYDKAYRDEYILLSYKAMNDFSRLFYRSGVLNIKKFKKFFELPGSIHDEERAKNIRKKMLAQKNKGNTSLVKEQEYNDKRSSIKCVGLTIETKPDWAFAKHGNEFLRYGATRVELGVQTVYDEVLKKVHRGHNLADTKRSIKELRHLGFKLNFHMMPGLPGVNKTQDIASLKEIFVNPAYRPDMLKIYPCMVMPGTSLYHEFQKGKFTPLTTKEAAEIIAEIKKDVPAYCRIMRVQRDIPTFQTSAGVDKTNLRQYVTERMQKKGYTCSCIRCREIRSESFTKTKREVITYEASEGIEQFISEVTPNNKLVGFARLFFPSVSLRKEITKSSAIIRELHVYGSATKLQVTGKSQHRGFGKQLLSEAERQAKKAGKNKMVIISGVGVRSYYRKLGYTKQGSYMVKNI
ncbi:MAG: tRNA uridine(34) 5-carboxymethylaminomethyl modification radical SAM/GNAT enzyme Elp3 [Candidatus Woesearchaeota archaeon]|nr:MAG: tRNA uridine(34) 5-carboxymethylaminomethyl modification radical SAM/GNAT enzyme Elp3 [Candidatus Woesearchaeota archaeon]